MLKQLLTASAVLAMLLAGTTPSFAQTQQKTLLAQTQPAPAAPVSPDDLQKFAGAIKLLLEIEQDSRTQIAKAIEGQGFSRERFREILMAQSNPQAKPSQEISQDEMQKFAEVISQAQKIQEQTQAKQEEAVKSQGLDVDRFNEILAAVRQNPTLKEQVQQMLK